MPVEFEQWLADEARRRSPEPKPVVWDKAGRQNQIEVRERSIELYGMAEDIFIPFDNDESASIEIAFKNGEQEPMSVRLTRQNGVFIATDISGESPKHMFILSPYGISDQNRTLILRPCENLYQIEDVMDGIWFEEMGSSATLDY